MLSLENGTIHVADDKIVLIIKKDDCEEFKKYKNVDKSGAIIDDTFYVGCTLNDQQLYITGSYPQEGLGDNTIMNVKSVKKKGGKCFSRLEEMKNLLGFNDGKEGIMVKALSFHPTVQLLEEKNVKITELEAAKKKAEKELRIKTQELQDQLDTAQQEKQDLEAEVEKLKAIDSTALQQQLEEKNAKITELEAQLNNQPNAAQLKDKDEKIKDLEAQLSNRPDAAQLKDKEDKIKELEAKINQPNAEVESLKKDLQARNARVHQLEKENKELEAKNKTTEQPKQGNGGRYTATVGMGLAAGLIAFTALERTVRLDIWVMVGIAVVSTLAVGSITYAALPSTQVNGAEVQGVSGGKTRQLNTVC